MRVEYMEEDKMINKLWKRRRRNKNKEFIKKITNKHSDLETLRTRANKELMVLLDIFSKESDSEINTLKEIKIHLEATQKETNYYGFRGIVLGLVVVILANIITTQILPLLFEWAQNVSEYQTLLEVVISQIVLVIMCIIFILIFGFSFKFTTKHFYKKEEEIREQIYINEYNILKIEEKIRSIENR